MPVDVLVPPCLRVPDVTGAMATPVEFVLLLAPRAGAIAGAAASSKSIQLLLPVAYGSFRSFQLSVTYSAQKLPFLPG